jgi:hypothetical protein
VVAAVLVKRKLDLKTVFAIVADFIKRDGMKQSGPIQSSLSQNVAAVNPANSKGDSGVFRPVHAEFAPFGDALSVHRVQELLTATMEYDGNLRKLLGTDKLAPSKVSTQTLTITLVRSVLAQSEKCFRMLLQDSACVVSLKTQSKNDTEMLTCHFSNSEFTDGVEHRVNKSGKLEPEEIPIAGTLPGRVISNGKPRFLPNIEAPDARILSEAELDRLRAAGIASMAGWPVRVMNSTCGVIVVDSRIPDRIHPNCPITSWLLKLITLKIGLIFAIAGREDVGREEFKKRRGPEKAAK